MGFYFDDQESIYAKQGGNIGAILTTIAGRYLAENPPRPVTYRGYCISGIRRVSNYRYHFNLEERFPEARPEEIVYAWAKLWSDQPADINLAISGSAPISLYLDGQLVFKTNIVNERRRDDSSPVKVKLNQGWNNFHLKFIKTPAGFGGFFGAFSPKSLPLHFLTPSREREGQEGWLFTALLAKELPELPGLGISESETGVKWFPRREWSGAELRMGQLRRMFGLSPGWSAAGWVRGNFNQAGRSQYTLRGWNRGPVRVYVDDAEIYYSPATGEFQKAIDIPGGQREVIVVSECGETDWGFEIGFLDGDRPIEFSSPCPVHGAAGPWFYLGPFEEGRLPEHIDIRWMDRLFPTAPGPGYWRLDLPDVWIRPYLENRNFGNWNYPLGVVLYGLLQTGRILNNEKILNYVREHVELSLSFYEYAQWDKQRYGAAGIHHLLTNLSCLDDCGSFGALMLELAKTSEVPGYRRVADFIAGFIHQKQERLPDGAFFRNEAGRAFMEGTLWVDDLYMSVPFLCRYYLLSGEIEYLNDAAKQLQLFYQYLYLPDRKILSHVYDTKIKKASGVPWGRGNGWAAFSFSEALAVLPEGHPDRPILLEYFNNLCEGYLALQDETGMWHQVLTDHESYPEASCTSMFTCAFARGVRLGWLQNPERFRQAALRAWNGLIKVCVDQQGNIYGVCRGSGFSFTADYYKNDLSWNLNDTHGTGIVLLAGVEVWKMGKNEEIRQNSTWC
ncbi:MAG: glycoside hydrolase family 88 protein [Firmicutes bacterium]|nr:glycoside hydrolase family 88 protein [Bacillota bacterium]